MGSTEENHMNQGDQNDRRLLREIRLENLLSFGPKTAPLQLENLNILIGPNAAGKSNLIEAVSLLRATPVSTTSSNLPAGHRAAGRGRQRVGF